MQKKFYQITQRLVLVLIFCSVTFVCFLSFNALYQFQNDSCIQDVCPDDSIDRLFDERGLVKRALFSPDDNIENVLVGLINAEREKISMTAFSLTSSSVANALINAKRRRVNIELVVDGENSISTYSKIKLLKAEKIPVWFYDSFRARQEHEVYFPKHGIMHNKFIIFKRSLNSRPLLWTGSYNFTVSANKKNQENVILTDEIEIITRYIQHFEIIKKRCLQSPKVA